MGLLEAVVGRDSAINVPNSVIGIAFYSLQALLGAAPLRPTCPHIHNVAPLCPPAPSVCPHPCLCVPNASPSPSV